jgi:hypothetical protein
MLMMMLVITIGWSSSTRNSKVGKHRLFHLLLFFLALGSSVGQRMKDETQFVSAPLRLRCRN